MPAYNWEQFVRVHEENIPSHSFMTFKSTHLYLGLKWIDASVKGTMSAMVTKALIWACQRKNNSCYNEIQRRSALEWQVLDVQADL